MSDLAVIVQLAGLLASWHHGNHDKSFEDCDQYRCRRAREIMQKHGAAADVVTPQAKEESERKKASR